MTAPENGIVSGTSAQFRVSESIRDSSIISYWDDVLQEWYYFQRNIYLHDAQNREAETASNSWNRARQQWELKSYTTYTFSTNTTLCISQNYNPSTQQYINNYQILNSYNAQSQLIDSYYFSWSQAEMRWDTLNGYSYSYDGSGNRIEEVSRHRNQNGIWSFTGRKILTYDTQNRQTGSLEELWSGSGWTPFIKTDHSYDAQGLQGTETAYQWDATLATWLPAYIYQEMYLQNGETKEFIYSSWNSETEEWEADSRGDYAYDEEDNLIEYTQFNHLDNAWVGAYKNTYYYSKLNTTSRAYGHEESDIAFPNPALDWINITNADNRGYQLWNTFGQLLRIENAGSKTIRLDGLPCGSYVLLYTNQRGRRSLLHFIKQ